MREADVKKLNKHAQQEYDKALKQFRANREEQAKKEGGQKGRHGKPPKAPKLISPDAVAAPFLRFDDWSKAQLAVEAMERKEVLVDAARRLRIEQQASKLPPPPPMAPPGTLETPVGEASDPRQLSEVDQDVEIENEDEEEDDEDNDDDDEEEEEDDDDDGDDEEEDDEVDDEGIGGPEDEELGEDTEDAEGADTDGAIVHVEAKEKTAEDDEFERMLAKTMKDTLETSRNSTSAKVASQRGLSSLSALQPGAYRQAPQVQGASATSDPDFGSGVRFQMLRKGKQGREEARSLLVPSSTSLASSYTAGVEERAKEKDIIKGVVLQYERDNEAREIAEEEESLQNQRTFLLAGRGGIHRAGGKGGKGTNQPHRQDNEYASLPLHRLKQPSVPQYHQPAFSSNNEHYGKGKGGGGRTGASGRGLR